MNKELCATFDQSRRMYNDYIKKHRHYVRKAFELFGDDIFNKIYDYFEDNGRNMDDDKSILEYLIQNHDMSKYSPEEFDAYADYFYPYENMNKTSKEINDNFDVAWKHHYSLNPHHPQYWYGFFKSYIPVPIIIEMLCDWIAVSMNNNTSVSSWYFSSRSKNERDILSTMLNGDQIIHFLDDFIKWNDNRLDFSK